MNQGRRPLRSRCYCGDLVGKWTSWTPLNPGRRFIGCPNFQDVERFCNYFAWVDSPLPDQWYRDILLQFHNNGGALNPDLFGDFMHHEPVDQVQEGVVMQQAGGIEGPDGMQQAGGSWKKWFLVVLAVIVVIMCME